MYGRNVSSGFKWFQLFKKFKKFRVYPPSSARQQVNHHLRHPHGWNHPVFVNTAFAYVFFAS